MRPSDYNRHKRVRVGMIVLAGWTFGQYVDEHPDNEYWYAQSPTPQTRYAPFKTKWSALAFAERQLQEEGLMKRWRPNEYAGLLE